MNRNAPIISVRPFGRDPALLNNAAAVFDAARALPIGCPPLAILFKTILPLRVILSLPGLRGWRASERSSCRPAGSNDAAPLEVEKDTCLQSQIPRILFGNIVNADWLRDITKSQDRRGCTAMIAETRQRWKLALSVRISVVF